MSGSVSKAPCGGKLKLHQGAAAKSRLPADVSVVITASANLLMKLFLPLSLAFLAILVAGCESPGRALKKSAVEQIRDGQTTKAEIDKLFGEPKEMTRSPSGRTLYYFERFYGPSASGGFGPATPFQDESNLFVLTVLFNADGVVEKHLYSHTRPAVDSRMRRAGRKLEAAELSRILPKKTTRTELGAWFGPHWSEQLTLSGERLVVWLHADAFNVNGRVDVQALEVLFDDAERVASFRVTKREP